MRFSLRHLSLLAALFTLSCGETSLTADEPSTRPNIVWIARAVRYGWAESDETRATFSIASPQSRSL